MPSIVKFKVTPYSTLILGMFPLHQIAHIGRQRERISLKLLPREIIFEEFQNKVLNKYLFIVFNFITWLTLSAL